MFLQPYRRPKIKITHLCSSFQVKIFSNSDVLHNEQKAFIAITFVKLLACLSGRNKIYHITDSKIKINIWKLIS